MAWHSTRSRNALGRTCSHLPASFDFHPSPWVRRRKTYLLEQQASYQAAHGFCCGGGEEITSNKLSKVNCEHIPFALTAPVAHKRWHHKNSTYLNFVFLHNNLVWGLTQRDTELHQTFYINEWRKNSQNKQCSFPHLVPSKLNFMSSCSFSTVDSVTLDSVVEFWQQQSTSDSSGGATISSPSSNAWDSSSSVTTTNIKKQNTEHCY